MNTANLIQAARGPIMLITVGALFAASQMSEWSFTQTWPLLIIVFGVLKLLERVAASSDQPTPPGGNPS